MTGKDNIITSTTGNGATGAPARNRVGADGDGALSSLKIAALAGGVGAARLLRGMVEVVDPSNVTAIVNTADDTVLHGLHISPDLDTITYTLAGLIDVERGWGLSGESWTVMESLAGLGGDTWFQLGDRDIATHMLRTDMLNRGMSLSAVTKTLRMHHGIMARILPMSDDRVQTSLTLAGSGEVISFQEYFVKLAHSVEVSKITYQGAGSAAAAPGVLEALEGADVIVICPSNPFLSIFPILALKDVRRVLQGKEAGVKTKTVAISPIIAGKALKGPADRLLVEMGVTATTAGVAGLYKDIASTFVMDDQDAGLQDDIKALGMRCVTTDTIMRDINASRALARKAIEAALETVSLARRGSHG
ncbi:MAG: 2-phospho-L-lactate transferase [Actinobacteria bacterium]|nr:2-phospho-L-lactate transferase [Actinomycetota bacterium]MCL5447517.1 2-phospho-L-lactate transferase [Actinomycetota bacterium]